MTSWLSRFMIQFECCLKVHDSVWFLIKKCFQLWRPFHCSTVTSGLPKINRLLFLSPENFHLHSQILLQKETIAWLRPVAFHRLGLDKFKYYFQCSSNTTPKINILEFKKRIADAAFELIKLLLETLLMIITLYTNMLTTFMHPRG